MRSVIRRTIRRSLVKPTDREAGANWHGWVSPCDVQLRLDSVHEQSGSIIGRGGVRPAIGASVCAVRTGWVTGTDAVPPHPRRHRLALFHPPQRRVPATARRARLHRSPRRRVGRRRGDGKPSGRRPPCAPSPSATAGPHPGASRLLLLAAPPRRGGTPLRCGGVTPASHRRVAAPACPGRRHSAIRADDAPVVLRRPLARARCADGAGRQTAPGEDPPSNTSGATAPARLRLEFPSILPVRRVVGAVAQSTVRSSPAPPEGGRRGPRDSRRARTP